ncbi:MAG TPA: patatin-like phospholipase family protein [Steroidobacter sp.]|jgi:predicted acylesterase/phospholipase RssA|nr:patatin-like phospholipase family protein [Steroidobacteraceae bacterium]HLS81330.1 patatin-like phospholipase family protein [Steroidobacter sp.]
MLQVEAAVRRRPSRRRIALGLAGGGPLGAFYQIGCLHALSECTQGLDLTDLSGYVGVSSGAIIAAGLANGLSTREIVRLFFAEHSAHAHALTPGLLMRPALQEYAQRALSVPGLAARALQRWTRNPFGQSWAEALAPLTLALPTGVFDNAPFERYLARLLSTGGRSNDFRKLKRVLRIVATDLNTGEEVRFGEKGLDHIPISQAIRASTALPGLYTPVRFEGRTFVDGALLRTVHASLVLEKGADLLISVNPLVAFDASRLQRGAPRADLADEGLSVVLNQTFRALIQSRMKVGMASYRDRYPYVDRLLFEPDRDDEEMFFANIFRYRDRVRLASHAYERTRHDLLAHAAELDPVLARHGVRLLRDRLADPQRTFLSCVASLPRPHPVTRELSRTLDQLADWLDRQHDDRPGAH